MAKNYKLTPEQWEQMFEDQGRACAICRKTVSAGRNWHTDHNHATNKVRGILCHDCNIAVGAYERTILPNLDAFAKWIVR